jgi:hypothetical protein
MKEILSEIVILTTHITLWSGRKRLKEEDLRLADGSQLPPAALASLGSKKVMDPAALAPFERLKRRAEREILATGTRFLNGYAVPKMKAKELMARLAVIEAEFETTRQDFIADYDAFVASWIFANPGWEDVIRRSVEDVGHVSRQLSFSVQTFTISPTRAHRSGLEKEVYGLAGQLRQEVGQTARFIWEASFAGKTEVGQRAIRPILSLASKVEGLVFLEQGLHELVSGIRTILDTLPTSGTIKGADFAAICGCLHLLGDIPEARENPLDLDMPEEVEELAGPLVDLPRPVTPVPIPAQWF